jgi:2-polyprenyl-3-methyl-5-hydroxy-6-metoxy-1,4-benzoquinol methylase
MRPSLKHRDADLRELMDDPECDPIRLARTYARFGPLNAVVASPHATYRRWIRPRLRRDRPARLLDIGTGGADFPRQVLRWARRDGLRLEAIGIDPDSRAIDYARSLPSLDGLSLRQATSAELRGEQFEIIVSNHVLHHLEPGGLEDILADSKRLSAPGGVVVHGDIERSAGAYAAYAALTGPLRGSLLRDTFIPTDGLLSIRRSYTAPELVAKVPAGWRVKRGFPWRLEVVWEGR